MSLQSIFVLIVVTGRTYGFEFLTAPDVVSACVGGSAHFQWSYDESKYDIQMIYWRFKKSGQTVLGHHFKPRDELVYYSYGRDRVEPLSGNDGNAGLLLKDIREADEGRYSVELSGPKGAYGEATMNVYTADELNPTLQIDNRNIEFGQKSNVTSCKACIVVITTANALPANIIISSGTTESRCKQKTTCSMSLKWDGDKSKSQTINFDVDYGFCTKVARSVSVYWGNPSSSSDDDDDFINGGTAENTDDNKDDEEDDDGSVLNTSLIIGVVIGILVTIILLLVAFICFMYMRMKRKTKRGKDLSNRQDRFYTTVQRIRGINTNGNRRHRPVVTRRSMSSPDPEAHHVSLDELDGPHQKDTLLKKSMDDDEGQRSDPDGEVGLKIVDDPERSPSTEEGVEARESDDVESGTASRMSSRMDSVDSSSFVVVNRDPDGIDQVNFVKNESV